MKLKDFVAKLADVMREHIKGRISPLEARIAALEERVAELQQRGYKGVWQAGTIYRKGDFVTDHGSMWACREDALDARPGSSAAWQLAVKRGRDARDAG